MTGGRSTPLPPIEVLDQASPEAFATAMSPLFEGAPRFLDRLADARPFGSLDALFAEARRIAHAMPVNEQLELLDAHPRLGAAPGSVSALSFVEQGYGRTARRDATYEAAPHGGPADSSRPSGELDRLNAAYEKRFGFRYCVFVDGRSRAELLPGIVAALEGDRPAEIARGLDAVVDIARDRVGRLSDPERWGAA